MTVLKCIVHNYITEKANYLQYFLENTGYSKKYREL